MSDDVKITIHVTCESDADFAPEEAGIPVAACKDAATLLAWLKDSYPHGTKEFLTDFDMIYDMDVKIGVTRIGDVDPNQMTIDGQPAQLKPQHTWAHW